MEKAFWRGAMFAGLMLAGLLACARAPAAPDANQAALEAAIHRWTTAIGAHDVATLEATMTEDVELLDASSTFTGRDAAIRALSDATRGKLVEMTREITLVDDVAWHIAGVARTQTNGDVQASGQALEIWKRVNGEWRLHRRIAAGDRAGIALTRPTTKEPVLDRARD
jgi:ketosteroid isomerase-like protein